MVLASHQLEWREVLAKGKGEHKHNLEKNSLRCTLIAVTWNIWIEQNRRIFNNNFLNVMSVCCKLEDSIQFQL